MSFLKRMRKLLARITGDIVYVMKPRLVNLGLGIIAKHARRLLILDIDDWEVAEVLSVGRLMRVFESDSLIYTMVAEKWYVMPIR